MTAHVTGTPTDPLGDVGRAVFALVPSAVVLVALDGDVVAASDATCGLAGRRTSQCIGRPLAEVFEEPAETVAEALATWARSSAARPAGLTLRDSDGDTRRVVASGARVPGSHYVLVHLRAREQATRALSELSREVEIEGLRQLRIRLESTLSELSRANRRLEANNEELERYASSISHDVRSPLATIEQLAEVLYQEQGGALPPNDRELLVAIRRLAGRTAGAADALLRLARVGSFEGVEEPADADAALAAAIEQLGIEHARDVEIVSGRLSEVLVHEEHLVQLFSNLLGNSLRYRDPARPVRIEVSAHREDGWIRFTVADNGLGVAAHERARIFEPSVRGSAAADNEGSGMGLALCRRLVVGYGGTIEHVETDTPGATFAFTLPVGQPGAATDRQATAR